jgi:hypothetical protein
MYYLEYSLREAGVPSAAAISILRTSEEEWVFRDLRAELADLYPAASIDLVDAEGLANARGLVVVPFADVPEFPLQDVAARHHRLLRELSRRLPADVPVLLYRAAWREVEVVKPGRLGAVARRKRLEAAAVRFLGRTTLLGRWLRPLY